MLAVLVAVLALALIPLAPMLLRLRLRILRWLHWDWAVNLLERHFDVWVLVLRVVLFVIAALALYFGWAGLRSRPAG